MSVLSVENEVEREKKGVILPKYINGCLHTKAVIVVKWARYSVEGFLI